MTQFASKFNKFNGFSFLDDTVKGFTYVKLKDRFNGDTNEVFPINGVIVFKGGNFGDSPVIIDKTINKFINVPLQYADTFREILNDPEAVEAIRNGLVGYRVATYKSKSGTECYSINFVDVVPEEDNI